MRGSLVLNPSTVNSALRDETLFEDLESVFFSSRSALLTVEGLRTGPTHVFREDKLRTWTYE